MFESKRVFWQFEVEGAEDEALEGLKEVEEALEEYEENAKIVKRAVAKVGIKHD